MGDTLLGFNVIFSNSKIEGYFHVPVGYLAVFSGRNVHLDLSAHFGAFLIGLFVLYIKLYESLYFRN